MVDKEEIEWCKTVRENCSGPNGEVVTCSNAAERDGYCIYCISDQLRADYAKLEAENKQLHEDHSESLNIAHVQGAAASQDVIRKLRERQPRNETAIAQLEARELRIKCASLEAENKRVVDIMNCRTKAWEKANLDLAYAKAENNRLKGKIINVYHMAIDGLPELSSTRTYKTTAELIYHYIKDNQLPG